MSSYQTRNREFEKNSKTIEKIKKTPIWLLFKPKQIGKGWEREKIKKNRSDVFTQPGIKKYQKIAKKFKKLKNTIMVSFQAKIGWKLPRMKEKKKNCSDEFLPDPEQKIPKKQQKN